MSRIITVTSGKGGVGKTNLSANLALCLADQGHHTCLFDADLGLANINILFGLYPECDLGDIIESGGSVREIVIKDYNGIDIIPGSSANEKIADLDPKQMQHLVNSFSELNNEYDYFILDTSAGISKSVISFCITASEIILIITPEPTSLTDGYALLKILSANGFRGSVMTVVNQAKRIENAKKVYAKFKQAVQKYLPVTISPLGALLHDENVLKAVETQQPFLRLFPNSIASKCLKKIAKNLIDKKSATPEVFSLDDFWDKCLNALNGPLQTGVKAARKKSEKQVKPPPIPNLDEEIYSSKDEMNETSPENKQTETTVEHDRSDQEIQYRLSTLENNIASIAKDISAIKKALETPKNADVQNVLPPDESIMSEATLISLDFDAFLKKAKAC